MVSDSLLQRLARMGRIYRRVAAWYGELIVAKLSSHGMFAIIRCSSMFDSPLPARRWLAYGSGSAGIESDRMKATMRLYWKKLYRCCSWLQRRLIVLYGR